MKTTEITKIKAILCDASKKSIEYVYITKGNILQDVYKLLGPTVELMERAGSTIKGDDIYCDEEGLLKPVETVCLYRTVGAPLMGNILITGHDGRGNMVDCKSTIEDIRPHVAMFTLEEAEMKLNISEYINQFQ